MRKIIISLCGILIVGALVAGVHFFWPDLSPLGRFFNKADSSLVVPEQGMMSQTITINNAKLVAREQFELSFPTAGQIESISTQEGLTVSSDSELIKLNSAELERERQKAEAVVAQNVAHVAKLKAGTRSEELIVSSDKVRSSKTSLSNSKKVLIDTIRAAYTAADDAVRNQADQAITTPQTNPHISFTYTDTDLENEIESKRLDLESSLSDWQNEVNGLKTTSNLTKANATAEKKLGSIRTFLDDLAYALNGITASGGGITQDELDTWKAALSLGRTNTSTAKNNLSSAFNSYRSSGRALTITESELGMQQSGNVSQDIDISRFQLEEAEQVLGIVEEKLRQITIKSPHNSLVVKKILPKEGERVQAGETVVSLATADLKIQIDIPEEDMSDIAIGKIVSVTLESFPDNAPATGTIETIEPQEVLKNENVYYRVYAKLDEQHPTWRTGMTGDAIIQIGTAPSALKVPRSAVYTKNSKKVVQVNGWNGPQEKEVTTGLSDQTFVEIRSGLTVTDTILRYPKPLP